VKRSSDVEVAVIGAGLAGLAAAAELRLRGHEVAVFEAEEKIGGVAQSERRDGFLFERGPNTFRLSADAVPFYERHGLLDHIERASPASRKRFLFRDGALEAVPDGILAFARSPLLSARGKLRLLAEPLFAGRPGSGEPETVQEFITRRFGREVSEALVGPFLTGVYAGDESELGAEAVFPRLVRAERDRGSISLGLALGRDGRRAPPGSWSGCGGAAALPAALAAGLSEAPVCAARCLQIRPVDGAVEVALAGASNSTLRAESTVLAIPAPSAAALLREIRPSAAALLESVAYAPIVNLSLGVASTATRRPVEGFGFLVPRGEAETLLGCLFPSQLFSGRAPAGHELLTAFAGGRRRPELIDASDAAIREAITADLDRALGLRAEPNYLGLTRWRRAIPHPDRHHTRRMEQLETTLADLPMLALAGGYLQGVAVSDTLLSGARAAERVSAALRAGA
jgi:oxygen-dependent protoporphyrinogen oxidase